MTVTNAVSMGWNAASFIALAVVLALLAAASTMLRFRARYITKARIGTDDILTLPAMVSPFSNKGPHSPRTRRASC